MFTNLFNGSKQNKNDRNNVSSTALFDGVGLIGKVLLSVKQWNNEFSKIQRQHQNVKDQALQIQNEDKKFNQRIKSQIQNQNVKQCKLCKNDKPQQNFVRMCKCQHKFCYACLNVYAISKVQAHERVNCPQLSCIYQLKLSSQIYKYLPQIIKLKYLQFKNESKAKNIELKDKCFKCLQSYHKGLCKVMFCRQDIENAYNYRKCPKCTIQIGMTQGRRKITCRQCNLSYCYLCSQTWPIEGDHQCIKKQQLIVLQHEARQSSFQNNDKTCCCCNCSQSNCLNNCNNCLNSCFYCKRCDISICLGNAVLVPMRLFVSIIILLIYAVMLVPVIIILFGWIFSSIFTGITCYTCQLIDEIKGCWQCVAYLAYPLMIFPGIFIALKSTYKTYAQTLNTILKFYSQSLCQMWVTLGPRQCCS